MLELRRVLEDLLDAGHARHAVADDHQLLHRDRLASVRLARGRCDRLVPFRPLDPHGATACSWARARSDRTRSASPGWRWPRRSGTARRPGRAPRFRSRAARRLCTRPRRDTTSTRSCGLRRSARASRGFISTHAFGESRSRIGTLPVFVRVCQCSTVRPVLSTNGNSSFGCSGNGSHVTGISCARPSSVWKPPSRIEPRASRPGRRAGRERPLHAAVLLDGLVGHARVVAQAAGRDALPLLERVRRRASSRERARRGTPSAPASSRKMSKSGRASPGGATARFTLLTRRSELV